MLGPLPFGQGRACSPKNTLRPHNHMCYPTKFRRSRSNRLGVRGVLKKFLDAGPSSLGMVACLPPRNTQRTQMCYHTKFRIGQTVWAQVGVSPPQKKMESWAPPLGAWLIHYKLNPVPEVLANQISWL